MADENTGSGDAAETQAAPETSTEATTAPVTTGTLADLKQLVEGAGGAVEVDGEAGPVAPKIDDLGRAYATGKRKNAIARVWIKPGAGRITVNGRDWLTYFARPVLRMIINQPFESAQRKDQYDVNCTVVGGGLSGQAGAVRHGISRALCALDGELRAELKRAGFLTRDDREKESKKYGLKKARKAPQYSKR